MRLGGCPRPFPKSSWLARNGQPRVVTHLPITCCRARSAAVKIRTEKDVAGIREACRIGREVRVVALPCTVAFEAQAGPTAAACQGVLNCAAPLNNACIMPAWPAPQVLDLAAAAIRPGITTDEIDRIVRPLPTCWWQAHAAWWRAHAAG